MARDVALSTLRTQARQRADAESSSASTSFVPDSELNSYINNSLAELYDLIIEANGDEYYATAGTPFVTSSGVAAYSLPADFYRMAGVDAAVGGGTVSLFPFPFAERNRYQDLTSPGWFRGARLYYRLKKEQIVFAPIPDGGYTITLQYIPNPPILVANGDVFNFHGGWEEYVIIDAAIKMLTKEESDVSVLLLEKQSLIGRIRAAAPSRDDGLPDVVGDVTRDYDDWLY
jgi:hypothetical protein